ncbi:glutaredoxin family protein [Amphritea sp. 2_MG-2023]|uniref:glutaredoxin family protein n=1 Tax=Amphritea TaxID=515417 RepID=UPI001C06925E|nr:MULTISPECIES: glutaredoxin family protein [Amphritea]MBU2964442.1 glutaredoxin family protein [Amphritea atlantica]MDO6417770.1 glutaredoxin family protein [Amphritea sp. 2_MG-2023]MDX2421264.1 glutaredoxin family protein [Amphritea sp.]
MRQFLLMSSVGCHLCDTAAEVLIGSLDPQQHLLDEVDIAYDDELMAKYAVLIPVLVDEASGLELRWPFDANNVRDFLASVYAQD